MKKILILSIFLLIVSVSFAQTVNGTPLKDIQTEYVEIVGVSNLLNTKVTINIDFGQTQNVWKGDDTRLLDNEGKPLKLNSMVDALNFMSANGYEFVSAYAITMGNQNVYHFLLKKKTI